MADDLPISPDDVEEIIAILSKSDYDTLDIETPRFRLRVASSGGGWSQEWTPIGATEAPAGSTAEASPEVADDGQLIIGAPLPGAFYRAPQPGAPPFVEVGDTVDADTVVAIIETMKLMTPVHAGVDGVIGEIIPGNGEQIEAGAVLMRVKPS